MAENAVPMDADICIVGSGPAGAIPAVRLAQSGYNVLVCEAGPMEGGPGVRHFIDNDNIAGKSDFPPFGVVQLGGFSNLWAGRMARMESFDFRPSSGPGFSGWPIGIDQLPYAEAFKLLSGGLDLPAVISAPAPFDALTGSSQPVEIKPFFWAKKAFNAGKFLRDNQKSMSDRLRILANAQVSHLVDINGGSHVSHAELRGEGGRKLRVSAKIFIVAAGGIETPRILLSSRESQPTGIGNARGIVGAFLSTHPKLNIARLLLKRPVRIDHPLFGNFHDGKLRIRYGLGLSAAALRQSNLLNHYIQLVPHLEFASTEAFADLRMLGSADGNLDRHLVPGVRKILPGLGRLLFNGSEWLGRLQKKAKTFKIRFYLDQFPCERNRVGLSGKLNETGIEKSKVEWSLSEQDKESALRFLTTLDAELRKASIGVIDGLDAGMEKMASDLTAIHSHYLGTTRMAANDREGVVDANCRVFGVDNLFVSGPSVFPTYGFANPFLTITALGMRLSSHIEQSYPR